MENLIIKNRWDNMIISPIKKIDEKIDKMFGNKVCKIEIENWDEVNEFFKDEDDDDEYVESMAVMNLNITELKNVIEYLQEIVRINEE